MGVTGVRGEQLLLGVNLVLTGVRHKACCAGNVVQIIVIARPAIHHDGPLFHNAQWGNDGGSGGGIVGIGSLLWVVGQRVAAAQDECHTLADGHRLEEFDHICVGGTQDAHIIDVDNDITCSSERGTDRKIMVRCNGCSTGVK